MSSLGSFPPTSGCPPCMCAPEADLYGPHPWAPCPVAFPRVWSVGNLDGRGRSGGGKRGSWSIYSLRTLPTASPGIGSSPKPKTRAPPAQQPSLYAPRHVYELLGALSALMLPHTVPISSEIVPLLVPLRWDVPRAPARL